MKNCISFSNLAPSDIDYIEAHGTGTKLGDPIEINALNKVFGSCDKKIYIGSIKSNIGHLDAASGLTSIIKAVYMLNNNLIPPNIYFKELNKEIDNSHNTFIFPTSLVKKELNNISVSSYGLGGTNCHAIVSKNKNKKANPKKLNLYMIPISYLRPEDLQKIKDSYREFLSDNICIEDFVYTLSTGKIRLKYTQYIIFDSLVTFSKKLSELDSANYKDYSEFEIPKFNINDLRNLYNTLPLFKDIYSKLKFTSEHLNEKDEYIKLEITFMSMLKVINVLSSQKLKITDELNKKILCNINSISKLTNLKEYSNIEVNSANSENVSTLERFFDFLGKTVVSTNINFKLLYTGLNWSKISTPGYPLKSLRFWIDPDNLESAETYINPEAAITQSDFNYTEEVIKIWEDILDIDSIDKDDDFYDLGGDSLLAIDILDILNKRFSLKLSLKDFLEYTTPLSIGNFLKANVSDKNKMLIEKDCIYKLRSSNNNSRNLFLFHPAGGSTFCYKSLNKYLNCDLNIYTIALPDDYKKYTTMENLAHFFIERIKNIQPHGPYLLGGYSFGGNLAFESAIQLTNENELVDKILMIDSLPPLAYKSDETLCDYNYRYALTMIIKKYLNLNIDLNNINDFNNISDLLKSSSTNGLSIEAEDLKYFFNKWVYNHKLLRYHQPDIKLNSKLLLIYGADKNDDMLFSSLATKDCDRLLWQNYFANEISSYKTPGNHFSIFSNKNYLNSLGNLITSLLE